MRTIFLFFLLAISVKSPGQTKLFSVSGKIKGLDSEYLSMYIYDESFPKGSRTDTIPVADEAFSFTTSLPKTAMVVMYPNVERTIKRVGRGYYPAKSSQFMFIASPGSTITFSGEITDFVNAYPAGDPSNADLAALNKTVYPLMNQALNIQVKIANKRVTDTLLIKAMQDTAEQCDQAVVELKKKFLATNPGSVAAAWLLSDMMIRSQVSNDEAIEVFGKMDTKLAGISYYQEVAERIDGIKKTSIGSPVPEINSLNTFDGKPFVLSALKGKYVVLDFWGTWCGPCIEGMPKMKEYLHKYPEKMEIVGVAQESDSGERWKKFIENSDYKWHHVLSRKNENYVLKFNVAGFPTKIIVDPKGVIIGRYVGEDEEIYQKLDELLK